MNSSISYLLCLSVLFWSPLNFSTQQSNNVQRKLTQMRVVFMTLFVIVIPVILFISITMILLQKRWIYVLIRSSLLEVLQM